MHSESAGSMGANRNKSGQCVLTEGPMCISQCSQNKSYFLEEKLVCCILDDLGH